MFQIGASSHWSQLRDDREIYTSPHSDYDDNLFVVREYPLIPTLEDFKIHRATRCRRKKPVHGGRVMVLVFPSVVTLIAVRCNRPGPEPRTDGVQAVAHCG